MSFGLNEVLNVISTIATVVGAGGVIALFISLKTLKADHDRSRRHMAVEMLKFWVINLDSHTSSASKFVENLGKNECLAIYNGEEFSLADKNNIESLKKCFDKNEMPDELLNIKTESVKVSANTSYHIRQLIVHYLNMLETIMLSARHNIADKDIVHEQFKYLYNKDTQKTLLQQFRATINAADNFPAITQYILHLESVHKKDGKEPTA